MGTKKGNQAGDLSLSSRKEEWVKKKKKEKKRIEKSKGLVFFF